MAQHLRQLDREPYLFIYHSLDKLQSKQNFHFMMTSIIILYAGSRATTSPCYGSYKLYMATPSGETSILGMIFSGSTALTWFP